MIYFSIVVPTIKRVDEVVRLLDSLVCQTCRDFEIILVDQNPDERLVRIVESYKSSLHIKHLRSDHHGAARARNTGLKLAHGKVIIWPDDDAWYPCELLTGVKAIMESSPEVHGVIGILVDEHNRTHDRWTSRKNRQATMMDAFTRAAEPVLVFRKNVVKALGGFNEEVGTGAQTPWGAGEGTDLCVRAIQANYRLLLVPDLKVFHERDIVRPNDRDQLEKARGYARGMGAVLRKNKLSLPFIVQYTFTYIRALCWNIIKHDSAHIILHKERIAGLFEGYRNY